MTTKTDTPQENLDTHPADWREQRNKLAQLVGRRVSQLQTKYCRPEPTSYSRAALAQLRRAALRLGSDAAMIGPDAFAVDVHTHVPDDHYPLNPDGRPRKLPEEPTEAELAVHTAMTLYAIHQQSRTLKGMHTTGERPGTALAKLAKEDGRESAVRRRFAALVTADTYPELTHHLRTMTRMLRDATLPMDYARLTEDLFTWQFPNGRNRVRLAWSRDFENAINRPSGKNEKGDTQ